MRRTILDWLAKLAVALTVATMTAAALAADLPQVIHGSVPPALVGEPITVDGPLLQIEVTPGIVVSAGRGAVLVLTPARESGDAFAVTVVGGPALALNMNREELRTLNVGTHLIGRNLGGRSPVQTATGGEAWTAPIESLPGYDTLSNELRQNLLLGDGLMVRQQQYLDKLKIDVTSINRIVVSIIRSMVPRP